MREKFVIAFPVYKGWIDFHPATWLKLSRTLGGMEREEEAGSVCLLIETQGSRSSVVWMVVLPGTLYYY